MVMHGFAAEPGHRMFIDDVTGDWSSGMNTKVYTDWRWVLQLQRTLWTQNLFVDNFTGLIYSVF